MSKITYQAWDNVQTAHFLAPYGLQRLGGQGGATLKRPSPNANCPSHRMAVALQGIGDIRPSCNAAILIFSCKHV